MKKQSVPLYILSAAVLLAGILIALRLPGRAANPDAPPVAPAVGAALSPADAYRLEKLNEVCGLVLERRIFLTCRIVPEGEHCEACWEKQIPLFMETLLYQP